MEEVVQKLVAQNKGILAADESLPTIKKRFDKIALESTQQNRQDYRKMLFGTSGIEQYLSGVILFEETLRQQTAQGESPSKTLSQKGIIPGVKVDKGTVDLPNFKGEKMTQGLDDLAKRLEEYKNLGAQFAKWRAVITIGEGIPSQVCIDTNAKILAIYASICQSVGVVPIVEPEVLMDGGHDINRCREVTTMTLKSVFLHLNQHKVNLKAMLLKPNMIIQGKDNAQKATPNEIADATLAVFIETVPQEVQGIVFLSGGQAPDEACQNLNAINQKRMYWQLSFSFGRALQDEALAIWLGSGENVAAAQEQFLKRVKLVSEAREGKYGI